MNWVLALSLAAWAGLVPGAPGVAGIQTAAAQTAQKGTKAPEEVSKPSGRAEAYYHFLQGTLLEATGRAEAALRAYEEALRLDPQAAGVHAAIAALHARRNQIQASIESAERAIAIDPENLEANRVLGLIYASLAEHEEERQGPTPQSLEYSRRAVRHLEAVVKAPIFPEAGVLLALGRQAMQIGAWETALSALTRLAEQVPDAPEVQSLIAEAEAESGRTADAIRRLEAVVERDPRQYPALGDLYGRAGRWRDAVGVYQKIVAANSRNFEAKLNLAQALLNLEDRDRALEARALLEAVLEARKDDAQALYLLTLTCQQLGETDQAETTARRLIAARPDVPVAYAALAGVMAESGRFEGALEVLRDAEKRFPSDTTILFQTGAVLEQQQRLDEAEEAFKKVLARDPSHAPALNYLGYMLAERGERLEESVEYIKRALAIEPDNAAYLDSLGWAYFRLGRLDLAEAPLRRAAEGRANDSIVQDHFAQVLYGLGRYKEAIAAWERALAGDGEDIDRKAIEAAIRSAREKLQPR